MLKSPLCKMIRKCTFNTNHTFEYSIVNCSI